MTKKQFLAMLDERGRHPRLPLTAGRIAQAKVFLLKKWQERAKEQGTRLPLNLDGACKFVSLFTVAVFGGKIQGNSRHQAVKVNGQVIDLTEQNHLPTCHDRAFFGNREHKEALLSCLPRVDRWVEEFVNMKPNRVKVAAGVLEAGIVYDISYHCTTPGPEPEDGCVRGYWNGDIDTWGKHTIVPVQGEQQVYLFAREIVELERVA